MKLFQHMCPTSAARIMVATVLAVVFAGSIGVPLVAQAEELVTAGDGLVSWQTSDTPSLEASLTPLFDWTIGSVQPTTALEPASVAQKKKRSVRRIIIDTGHAAHLSQVEVKALLWLAWRESRFHPTSHSRSNCHGLFQLSKGMAHGKPWKNPVWNTKRAIKYMRGRYGGVLQAQRFWRSHHWY